MDGFPASFELVYEPGFVVYHRPPYGYEDLTTIDPASCPLAANQLLRERGGQRRRDPARASAAPFRSPPRASAGGSSARAARRCRAASTPAGAAGTGLQRHADADACTRRNAARWTTEPWTLRFADGETETLRPCRPAEGVATGIEFPRALGRCGGPYGNLNLFISAQREASLKGAGGAYTLSLGFTGADARERGITVPGVSCGGSGWGLRLRWRRRGRLLNRLALEVDLDVLLLDPLLDLRRGGQRALVGLEQRRREEAPRPQAAPRTTLISAAKIVSWAPR